LREDPDREATSVNPSDVPNEGTEPDVGGIAVVPAKNSPSIEATVAALRRIRGVTRVVVVDDGSTDDTGVRALAAAAEVLALPVNRGKGAALGEAVLAHPDAPWYLLADADLAETAEHLTALVERLLVGDEELVVARFPPAGTQAGAGRIKALSAAAIRSTTGVEVLEPLSGQRAIDGATLRSLHPAPRFGVEVGMSIDALRAGARLAEVSLPLDHDHTGRGWAGRRHRIRQGIDIVRTVWPRLGTPRLRLAVVLALSVVAIVASVGLGKATRWHGEALPAPSAKPRVILVTIAGAGMDLLEDPRAPAISSLARSSATASVATRVPAPPGDLASQHASLGAGAPVALVVPGGDLEFGEAEGLTNESPATAAGPVKVQALPDGSAQVIDPLTVSDDSRSYGTRGLLGDSIRRDGGRVGYVWAGKGRAQLANGAAAVADDGGTIDTVDIAGVGDDPDAAARRYVDLDADLILVETRRSALTPSTLAVSDVDRVVAAIDAHRRPTDTLIVLGLGHDARWHLSPLILSEPGLRGTLGSDSTRRQGIMTMGDVSATVLNRLDRPRPKGLGGAVARIERGAPDIGALVDLDRRVDQRERSYAPTVTIFIVIQALAYIIAPLVARRSGRSSQLPGVLVAVTLGSAAFPVLTFLWRLMPVSLQGPFVTIPALTMLCAAAALLAMQARRFGLSPLNAVAGVTLAVMVVDASLGAPLQQISLLGYSPVTAARFYGLGNMAFAVLGACAVIVAASWLHAATDRRAAFVAVAGMFALVVVVDAAPMLGADFGGVLTFVPAFGLLLAAWSPITWNRRNVALAVLVGLVSFAVAVGVALKLGSGTHLDTVTNGGWDGFTEIVRRKVATNLRVMRLTVWSWMVPIAAFFLLLSLTTSGTWRERFRGATDLRTGLMGLFVVGFLGGAVNDSGIVIPALALVYIGAFLMLVQVRKPFEAPEVRLPEDASPPIKPAPAVSG
jgi:hypothetical protein